MSAPTTKAISGTGDVKAPSYEEMEQAFREHCIGGEAPRMVWHRGLIYIRNEDGSVETFPFDDE